jgi:hypothetical protein
MKKDLIISNIDKANHSINIAVSWLTDKDIISALIEKAKEKVMIKILLSSSYWNLIRYEQFKILSGLGVAIFKKGEKEPGKGNFMHCKFCIIDEKTSIHGSYNWTKLGNTNDENLEISEDYDKARDFNKQFYSLLQDSEDFYLNLDIETLSLIISQYQEMENNNIEPADELKTGENTNSQNLVKVESTLPAQKELKTKIEKLEQLKEADFNQIKKLDFRGDLKLISYSYIDNNVSSLTLSSDIRNGLNRYSLLIKNSILGKGLLNSDEKFKTFYSRLGGFPDVLLSMIMVNREISLTAGIEIDEPTKKYFLCKTDSDRFIIKFSYTLWPSSLHSDDTKRIVQLGSKYFWDIIEGKVTREDIEKQFRKINWII